MAGHPPVQSPFELGSQGEFAKIVHLLLGKDNSLLAEGLVLHAVQALLDVLDLSGRAVGGVDGRSHAECAVPERGAILLTRY